MISSIEEYFELARRTQQRMRCRKKLQHAKDGLTAEVGEVLEAFRMKNAEAVKEECGDVCWFICELCDLAAVVVYDFDIDLYIDDYIGGGYSTEDCVSMLAEANGKLHGIYQKRLQGHPSSRVEQRIYVERMLALVVLISGGQCIHDLYRIMDANVAKLEKRYPNGFSVERSLHRNE